MAKSPSDNPRRYRSPGERDLDYEDVALVAKDGIKLKGWLILHPAAKDVPTVVFFHENAGSRFANKSDIGARLDFAQLMIQQVKCNFLMVAYRGYSDSEGTPSEEGLKHDGIAIMEYATGAASKYINPNNLIVMGRSLGGAVATYVVSTGKYNVKGKSNAEPRSHTREHLHMHRRDGRRYPALRVFCQVTVAEEPLEVYRHRFQGHLSDHVLGGHR